MRKMLLFGLVAVGLLLAVWFTQMPARTSSAGVSVGFEKTWGGADSDYATGVAVDGANIYVVGTTGSFGTAYDAFILKYNAVGSLVWQKTWGGAGYDCPRGMAVDQGGNIYVVGDTRSFGVGMEAFILKYNAAGTLIWQKTWGGDNDEYGRAVAVDQVGNIYVVGDTNSFGVGYDAFILKFNAVGSLMWQKTWGGASLDVDWPSGVAVDGANIYVVGTTDSSGTSYDAFILKYNAVGSLMWQKTWRGADDDLTRGVAVDQVGNIYVVGDTDSFGVGHDAFILKYNAVGSLMWQKTWGGADSDSCYGVASGSVYVTGSTHSSPPRTLNDVNGTETTPSGTETTPGGTMITPSGTETTPSGTETTPSGEPSQGNGDAFLISLFEHDVAVVNVTLSKTVVGQGYCMSINATVENQGTSTETFNVTAYYGNATITPEQWETFWSMGDVNRDGYIDDIDGNLINAAIFSEPGDPNWCSWADLDQSNHVDTGDMLTCSANIGLEIWTYFVSGGVIGTQTVSLPPYGDSTTLTFTWETTGVPYGNYTVSGYATPIFWFETDRADNNYGDGRVLVTIPGDMNGDGTVDNLDAEALAGAYGSTSASPNWNPNADINDDGTVDIFDIYICAIHWEETL